MTLPHRPVILLGHGVRLAGAADLVPDILDLGVPVLTSWPAADMVDSCHHNYFGRPGVYGQRCANKVLDGADAVLAIGCRLSIWTVGYSFPEPHQTVFMVDCDEAEFDKFPRAIRAGSDIRRFIDTDLERLPGGCDGWLATCMQWRHQYPWLESPTHNHTSYINPHRFMAQLQPHLAPNHIIVADCATGSIASHQILRLKPPQRLMTSGGLGEMGCGLPAAIGAAFANKGPVLCLTNDGGIMLTLSELQTIVHHQLPIKIVVFANDGYGMIKDTQRNLGYSHVGVNRAGGVSCPNFADVAQAFGIRATRLEKGDVRSLDSVLAQMFATPEPELVQVDIDPEYVWAPKLRPLKNADGSIRHAQFGQMEPIL